MARAAFFLIIKTRNQILSLISALLYYRRSAYLTSYLLIRSARCTVHVKPLSTRRGLCETTCVVLSAALPSSRDWAHSFLAPVPWRARALPPLAEGPHETHPRHRQQSFRPAVSGHRRAQCTWVSAACLPLELPACPPEPSHASLPAPSASSVSSARPPPHAPTAHSASLSTCRQATMDINEHANCVEDPGRCVWAA